MSENIPEKYKAIPEVLKKNDIQFELKEDGAHIVIHHDEQKIDFWQATGTWCPRGCPRKTQTGIDTLIKYIKKSRETTARWNELMAM